MALGVLHRDDIDPRDSRIGPAAGVGPLGCCEEQAQGYREGEAISRPRGQLARGILPDVGGEAAGVKDLLVPPATALADV
jgi:hypothetical protein